MKPRRTIHEKHGIADIVFLGEFGEKQLHGGLISRRRYMQQIFEAGSAAADSQY